MLDNERRNKASLGTPLISSLINLFITRSQSIANHSEPRPNWVLWVSDFPPYLCLSSPPARAHAPGQAVCPASVPARCQWGLASSLSATDDEPQRFKSPRGTGRAFQGRPWKPLGAVTASLFLLLSLSAFRLPSSSRAEVFSQSAGPLPGPGRRGRGRSGGEAAAGGAAAVALPAPEALPLRRAARGASFRSASAALRRGALGLFRAWASGPGRCRHGGAGGLGPAEEDRGAHRVADQRGVCDPGRAGGGSGLSRGRSRVLEQPLRRRRRVGVWTASAARRRQGKGLVLSWVQRDSPPPLGTGGREPPALPGWGGLQERHHRVILAWCNPWKGADVFVSWTLSEAWHGCSFFLLRTLLSFLFYSMKKDE